MINSIVVSRKRIVLLAVFIVSLFCFTAVSVSASDIADQPTTESLIDSIEDYTDSGIDLGDLTDLTSSDNIADTVKIVALLTIIALAPSILVLMTGFTRILIVLSFVRNALGLQQTPPNQVLIGLSLFLTFFLMSPLFTQIYDNALVPYMNEEITIDEAIENALEPERRFMIDQTSRADLRTFLTLTGTQTVDSYDDIGLEVLIPAFVISELKVAFIIGFFIYIPFLIIDLVVASTLMSLGMMMLPPAMISMPFKLILFLIVDGWGLIVNVIMTSF